MRMEKYIKQYRALSDETRVRIMFLLRYAGQPLCVCEIMDSLAISQYNASRHLNILKISGLVRGRKKGTWVFYSLSSLDDKFQNMLLLSVASMPEQLFTPDIRRFKKRFSMREGGECVVGVQKQ